MCHKQKDLSGTQALKNVFVFYAERNSFVYTYNLCYVSGKMWLKNWCITAAQSGSSDFIADSAA